MIDFNPPPPAPELGGIFGKLSEIIGLSPTVIAAGFLVAALYFGDPFITLLLKLLPGL